jgi:hypothetical protein
MGEEIKFTVNDTSRSIERIIEDLRTFESCRCDARVKAIVLTQLEQAMLWSYKLIKDVAAETNGFAG